MAYDRYDRDQDRRWQDERSDRDWRSRERGEHRDSGRSGDDRGFFERAGEQISSWFGGMGEDDRSRDRSRDDHFDRNRERGSWSSGDRNPGRDQGRDFDREHGRNPREERGFNEDRGLFNRGGSSDRDYHRGSQQRSPWGGGEPNQDRGRYQERDRYPERGGSGGGYRPLTGDYGRGTDRHFASGRDENREQNRRLSEFHRESDRTEGPWSQDQYRRTSFAGSQKIDRDYDPNYRDWRDRHMSEIDADYHDYRREHQSRFEDDFSGWRSKRQEKRGLLSRIREHMEVVGSDGEHVGTVDKVAGDRIILTKSDPASGGRHHSIGCSAVDRVEDNRIVLDSSARDARNRWRDEDRSRALFERHEQGEEGPGVLNRSFSGTYRDR